METTVLKKEKIAMDYLGYALYAFGGLGIEILLMMLETNLWGISNSQWTISQHVIHWSVTCLIWGVLAFLLLKQVPKQYSKIKMVNVGVASFIILVSIVYTTFVWNGFKPIIEFANNGLIKFVIQYVYYACESILILLIIIFGQMFFEKIVCRKSHLPAGSIILVLTWGLIHILTQGLSTGIYACIQACLFGCVYLALDRSIVISYVAIALMFML